MLLAEFNLLSPMGLALLLALVGCFLVVVEVLVPSGGIIGFFSLCFMVASVYYAYRAAGVTGGLTMGMGLGLAAPLLVVMAFKILPYTPIGRAVLGRAPSSEEVLPEDSKRELLGRIGIVRSKMLPSGAVEIDGRMIDAVSQGRAIDPGEYVKVVEVRGNRVVVRRADQGERPSHENPADLLARPIEELGFDPQDEDPLG
ncbi:MAG: hypothetical protein KDA37_06275 [Planctomycetales bacterium]|nr:hypothetical protein [Planctomycetales bacterium]